MKIIKEKNIINILKIVILGLVLLLLPLWFLRLFDDEILYLIVANHFWEGKYSPRSSLAFLIASPLVALSPDFYLKVMLPRILTALITLLNSVLIYLISRKIYSDRVAILSAVIFLLSFDTLRFGARYNLEPYGLFFALLCIYFFVTSRITLSGICIALAFAAREMWIAAYPFYMFYIWMNRRKYFFKVLASSSIIIIANIMWIHLLKTKYLPITVSASKFLLNFDYMKLLLVNLRNWSEVLVGYFPAVLGFVYWLKIKIRNLNDLESFLLILITPSLFILNFIPGFILNGPFERYFYGPNALLSIVAGFGLIKLIEDLKNRFSLPRINFTKILVVLIVSHIMLLNAGVYALSEIGANGVYDFGFWYDQEIIEMLNKDKKEKFIAGTPHGFFIKNATWKYTERRVKEAIDLNPDWLITYKAWVKVKNEKCENVKIYYIGPYIVVHRLKEVNLSRILTPSEFGFWKFRRID